MDLWGNAARDPIAGGIRIAAALMVLLVLSPPFPADAARLTLLRFGKLTQNISLGYEFDQQSSQSDGGTGLDSTSHRFDERYRAAFRYAVLSPRLLNGSVRVGANLEQENEETTNRSASDGSSHQLEYNVNGTWFQRSWYPVTFFTYQQHNRVRQAFTPSYDIKTDGVGATLSLQNNYVPTLFNYSLRSNATSGAGADTENTIEAFLLSFSHNYRSLSNATLSLSLNKSDTVTKGEATTTSSDTRSVVFRHLLNLGTTDLTRTLNTLASYVNETGTVRNHTLELNESLDWWVGKALQTHAIYIHRDRTFADRKTVEDSGVGWIQHRLYKSLTTRLDLRGKNTTFDNNGSITEIGGGGTIDYEKKLPEESSLLVGVGYNYGITDNKLGADALPVINESATVPDLPPYELVLGQLDVNPDSIVVRNRERTFIYTPGTDYQVVPDGRETRIVFPQIPTVGPVPITAGSILSIDYEYRLAPSITYSQSVYTGYATLSLFQERHRLFVRVTDSSQDVLENRGAGSPQLSDYRTLNLGFESRREFLSYGASYLRIDSDINPSQTFEGYSRYVRSFGRDLVRLNLRERYTLHDNGDGRTESSYTNTLNLTGEYLRPVTNWATMRLIGDYLMVRGRSPSDEVSASVELNAQLGRTELSLFSELAWKFLPQNTNRSTAIRLQISRSF
ncbi:MULTISPECIES: hypothetical protein [Geobacter]|uniref:hypothetical protein n=1 Tax=Geobacter TaxID=28231 RepID=UPI0025739A7C|nr:hypothetical protein [Geobacter sulfurreducens]BEH11739.1 hypothetical protein GSUET_33510 [Geobacter sulfurreducens subsp. ethanolicus]BET59599.1 hypothetical protein GEO60473_26390 [Geobacter sp. 60473]